MKPILTSVLLIVTALTLAVPTTAAFASTQTDENGFNQGYDNGLAQGQIGHQAKMFHIGSVCIGQTLAWCDGFIAGYLDGFFSTIPTNTVTHSTTTRIIVHEGHHTDNGCHPRDNMTVNCKDGKIVKPDIVVPPPVCNPSPCESNNSPSTPSTPSTPDNSGSGSSGSGSGSGSSSGSSGSGSNNTPHSQPTTSQPTQLQ